LRWRERDGVRWLEADLEGECATKSGARAAFSTRLGGVSEGPFESLNLGRLTGDLPDAVRQNRHRLAAAIEIDPELVLIGRQVHGAEVAWHDRATDSRAYANFAPGLPEVDGHATAQPDLTPLVFVADCLPVALAGPGGVAMIHCGWRGLAAGIVKRGVEEVKARAAAVGPGIGPCCYEVGDEIADAYRARFGPGAVRGRNIDLWGASEHLLGRAGVHSIERLDLCTACDADRFFSHRRDRGVTGRQGAVGYVA
jgi:polyphenol oxidase